VYLFEYINDKIKEKYPKMAKAYRFFDVSHKSAVDKQEFANGLKKLKIVMDDDEVDQVFHFLDKDKDGLLTYKEFCYLIEEKFKNSDVISESNEYINDNSPTKSAFASHKSTKTFTKKHALEDYKDTSSTVYKPFFKTNKKMQFMASQDGSLHGIATLPSDNIKNIVNHGYEKQYLEHRTKKDQDQLLKILIKEENCRGQDTKASVMRNQAIKDKIEHSHQQPNNFKLKQFDEVKPSCYISDTTKDIKKKHRDSCKKSNIETESVLKIADMMNRSNQAVNSESRENKKVYLGQDDLKKLEDDGSQVYKYDIKKNEMSGPHARGPTLGAYAIASRLKKHSNAHKTINKSVDNRNASQHRGKTSLYQRRKQNMNNSMLPDIKKQAQRRNISQIKRQEGEYSKMLSNHNNNRLVQAQRTIDEALRKHRMEGPTKQQRNDLGNQHYLII